MPPVGPVLCRHTPSPQNEKKMIRQKANQKTEPAVPLAFLYIEAIGAPHAYRMAKPVVRFVKESHPEAAVFDFDSYSDAATVQQAEALARRAEKLVVAVSVKDPSGAWKLMGFFNKLAMTPNLDVSATLLGEEESIARILGALDSDFVKVATENEMTRVIGRQIPH